MRAISRAPNGGGPSSKKNPITSSTSPPSAICQAARATGLAAPRIPRVATTVPTLQANAPATTITAAPETSGGQSGPCQTTTVAPTSPTARPVHWRPERYSPSTTLASAATNSGSVLASTAARPAPAWRIPQKVAP